MSKFQRIDISHILDTSVLREKLKHLLENKEPDEKYSAEKERSCYDALERYIEAKKTGTPFDSTILREMKLEEYPELMGIVMQDMLSLPTVQTERLLHSRDNHLSSLGKESSTMCGSAIGNHWITITEERALQNHVFEPTMQNLGLGTAGISSKMLVSKFRNSFSHGSMSEAQIYSALSSRLEQVIEILRQFDEISPKDNPLVKGEASILNAFLRDAKNNLQNGNKIALFQNPRVLLSRLNFLNYINTTYNGKKKYDASISFDNPHQLISAMLMSDVRFLDYFDYEFSDIMTSLKYVNNQLDKKVSYSKMEEIVLHDPLVLDGFMENNSNYKEMLDKYPELRKAIREGEKAYTAYINLHPEQQQMIENMKDEARTQFRRLALNSEFGTITPGEKRRLDRLSKETLERTSSKAIEEAQYTVVDMTPGMQRGNPSGSISHLPPIDRIPKRRSGDKYNPLTDPVARSFITDVVDDDIIYEGIIGTNVGLKAKGRDKVYYFVFRVGENGEYRVLEPIGQPHNSTFIVKSDQQLSEFAQVLSKKRISLDRFVANEEAIRVYHATKRN